MNLRIFDSVDELIRGTARTIVQQVEGRDSAVIALSGGSTPKPLYELLGIGDDGHTASLFPGTPVLDVEDRIAAEVFVPRLDQWRVTITKPVIRDAALRLVLAAGEPKARILREVRDGADYPIALVTRGVETWWMIDRPAAP